MRSLLLTRNGETHGFTYCSPEFGPRHCGIITNFNHGPGRRAASSGSASATGLPGPIESGLAPHDAHGIEYDRRITRRCAGDAGHCFTTPAARGRDIAVLRLGQPTLSAHASATHAAG